MKVVEDEVVRWKRPVEEMPDADETVLVKEDNKHGEVRQAWTDGQAWYESVTGEQIWVRWWASWPGGPPGEGI